ncbi:MAG: transporter related [Paenibacillaceae bacterium]|nr:transporter related [Paenibacillaceae bacterium]
MEEVLKVHGVCKTYGPLKAVDDVSFSLNRGEVLGLLGANGAGKSTVLECILGTKEMDSGTVLLLGENPRANRKQLFQRIGVQFQESGYQDKITVAELCEVTRSLYRNGKNYRELLVRFGLEDKAGSTVNELSGGQKQRLFIILALIPDPEIVFLDELTTGLDARARREVWKYLAQLKAAGLSMLMTSHFMDEVEALCDIIGIMKHGKIIFKGTVEEAIANSPHSRLEEAYLWYTDEEVCVYESI